MKPVTLRNLLEACDQNYRVFLIIGSATKYADKTISSTVPELRKSTDIDMDDLIVTKAIDKDFASQYTISTLPRSAHPAFR